jgi:signal transduction histidine kinase
MPVIWPKSLAGRLIVWLMLVLTLALALALGLQRMSNARLLAQVAEDDAVMRITMVSRILEQSGTAKWPQTLHAATSEDLRFSLGENVFIKQIDKGGKDNPAAAALSPEIRRFKNGRRILFMAPFPNPVQKDQIRSITVTAGQEKRARQETEIFIENTLKSPVQFFDRSDKSGPTRIMRTPPSGENGAMEMAIKLENGRWLNAAFTPQTLPFWSWEGVLFLGLLALAIGGVIMLVVRHETRPMQHLAQAAEALGRGEHLPPLTENGPREVRLAVEAFNLMGERLGRFVQGRTHMLAAMSHDLRTPLTTLRLRAEMIDEPEARDKLIDTIEEMHRITEASLSFAREENLLEDTQQIDLSNMLQTLCDEAQAMDFDVRFDDRHHSLSARIRPDAMRRAIRNLIDNAVRYGNHAHISLQSDNQEIRIIIEDDGPGIADNQLEEVFSPFVRLETSRNQKTGGAGLGLSIARTIARAHGGDVVLQNRKTGGLRAILRVPGEAD